MQSMTGYGRLEQEINEFSIIVEIKSVNHRYSEYSITVPKYYGFLEERVRQELQKHIGRGKISVYISVYDLRKDAQKIVVNEALAAEYISVMKRVAEQNGLPQDFSVTSIMRFSDVLNVEYKEIDEDEIVDNVKTVLNRVTEDYINMRRREGGRLQSDMMAHCAEVERKLESVIKRAPKVYEEGVLRMKTRIAEISDDAKYNEQRLLTEITLMADKLSIDEEIIRLRSHIEEFYNILKLDEPVGRKLDFLVQEINREVNTIGSKANDVEIGKTVVDMKTEIEKIREQIQNIE